MTIRRIALVSAFATLLACGDDGAVPVASSELTIDEIETIFGQLGSALSTVGLGPSTPSGAPPAQAVPVEFETVIDHRVPCESGAMTFNGGTSGVADSETGAFDLAIDFIVGFEACVIQGEGELAYTLDSAPGVRYLSTIVADPAAGTISSEGSQSGGVRILASDGRDVTCLFDVTYTSSIDQATGVVTRTVSGTVCGVDVNSVSTFTVLTGA